MAELRQESLEPSRVVTEHHVGAIGRSMNARPSPMNGCNAEPRSTLPMALAPDKEGGVQAWLKLLWPLLALLAAASLVLAMGWHRYLTLQELVLRRESLRAAIADHTLLALVAFTAIYAGTVALSLPGGAVLTLAGGFLFGWFWGGVASILAAT